MGSESDDQRLQSILWEWNEEMLTNETGTPERVIRGGDWVNSAGNCAASFRTRHLPTDRGNACGLRLARVP